MKLISFKCHKTTLTSTLVQIMVWCCQATDPYSSQCWPRSVSPYGVIGPECVKYWMHLVNIIHVMIITTRQLQHVKWCYDLIILTRLVRYVLDKGIWLDFKVFFIKQLTASEAHYNDVIMSAMASQITSLATVYSIVYSDAHQRKHQNCIRYWPLWGEFTVTGEFPAQRASNAENVSIWWLHHEMCLSKLGKLCLMIIAIAGTTPFVKWDLRITQLKL